MGTLKLYEKQHRIWTESRKQIRNLLFCGGIQCGKTTLGAAFMTRLSYQVGKEFGFRNCDQTAIIAAPTYKILTQATLPKFLSMNGPNVGTYNRSDNVFRFHWGFTIYMRTSTRPESMEGISNCRGAWADEGGLMPRYFWENLMGRVARLEAPTLVTTTPYAMNWLAEMAEQTLKGKRDDTILIQARSVDSPYFPKAEYDRQMKLLDPRRFAMKYEGQFGKMQGLVYPELPLARMQTLPAGTKYYAGIDWGHTDPFALVVRAVTPAGVHHRCDEFYKTGLIASEIMRIVMSKHQIYRFEGVFCDPSRPEYIEELSRTGVPAEAGINDIQLGIDKQRELMRTQKWFLWEDMCPYGKDEYESYHYPEPEELGFDDDQKEQLPVDAHNHGCDADRYCTMGIVTTTGVLIPPVLPSQRDGVSNDPRVRINQLKRLNRNRTY